MKILEDRHLNENQILMAVVDRDLLPATTMRHLSACRHCQTQKYAVGEELYRLGEKARRLAPAPRKKPCLPVARSKNHLRHYVYWPASAVSAMLLLAAAWWGIFSSPPSTSVLPGTTAAESWEDEALMTEVSTLSEDALSEEYTQLVSTADLEDIDEDFFEYVVPCADNQPLSDGKKIQGGQLC